MTDAAQGIRPLEYRLPDDTRLGTVRLDVTSLDRSIAWYESVLGLTVTARTDAHAVLTAGNSSAPLVEFFEQKNARPVPPRGRLGLYHFAILLPDRSSLGRFATHLAELGVRAGMSDHLVSEALYLRDPDGLGIEVYADRDRSTWRFESGELAMASAPLDLDDLIASAHGVPWTGAPAGTVMGHMHLHVGDLEQGRNFYHRALGLDEMAWSYPGALFMSAGGYHHHLGTNTWAVGAEPAREGDARLREWELILPDNESVEAAAKSLRSHGYTADAGRRGVSTRDPWGTLLRLVPRTQLE